MSYKEYTVRIYYTNRTEWYNADGELHRTDGPAVEYVDGTGDWFLENKQLTAEEHRAAVNPAPHEGCTVTIDGTEYKLHAVK